MKTALGYLFMFVVLFAIGMALTACDPATETLIKGDRSIVQVTAGVLKNGSGDARNFFILRDPLTGVDYLAVVDAGIIKMEPIPKGVEK